MTRQSARFSAKILRRSSAILDGKFPHDQTLEAHEQNPISAIARGFMPGLLSLSTAESRTRWWEGYTATYFERDLRQLSQVESLSDFRTVMKSWRFAAGKVINQTNVARDSHVSQATRLRSRPRGKQARSLKT